MAIGKEMIAVDDRSYNQTRIVGALIKRDFVI